MFESLRHGSATLDDHDACFDLALAHQIAAPLASLALARGESIPERWRERLMQVRAQNLAYENCLTLLVARLDGLSVPWFATRGAVRLSDPVVPDRLCGDIDLYIDPADWPKIEATLSADSAFERDHQRGEKNRSTRHFNWTSGLTLALDFHLGVSPFHSEGGGVLAGLLARRVRNAAGLWVLPPEDDYGMALVEALIESPANRLRRLWELDALAARLSAGEHQRMRRRFGLRRWSRHLPERVFRGLQGRLPMRDRKQVLVRYGGLATLIAGSRRPLAQTRDSLSLMLRRFRT